MAKRVSYYKDLSADFSRPGLVSEEVTETLLSESPRFQAKREAVMPEIGPDYTKAQIEAENREWFPTHCQALRSRRFDLLENEYRDEFVYMCQDGFFRGKHDGAREQHWVAVLTQPGATMTWPIVMFDGEVIYFEWQCLDDETNETIAKGNVTFLRRGHRGGIYVKTEQLTFYRDVYASADMLKLLTVNA
jgi:hypothetical protein